MKIRNKFKKIYLRTFKRGYYHKHQDDLNTFIDLIPTGSLCFDVGANRGDKTKALLASGMKVISFEPQKKYLEHIENHCAEYSSQLVTRNTAVGNSAGECVLYLSEHVGEASLDKDWSKQGTGECITVPITTLDREIDKYGCPYFCKIDVEGHELQVLQGLSVSILLISFEYHLNDKNIEQTFQCLERLSSLAEISCNITGSEDNTLHWDKWKSVSEFKQIFPDQFRENHHFRYGDIYVRQIGERS